MSLGKGPVPDSTLPNLCVRGNEGFFLYETSGAHPYRPYQIDRSVLHSDDDDDDL